VIILLRTLGILLVAGGLIWMSISEVVLKESHGAQVRAMILSGVGLLVVSIVLSMFGRVSARLAGRRCPRCGKPVAHGHIYCSDHLKEAVNQFRDSQRQKGN
jgi:predicted nucleic acid-binding Zn ribbon protein